jgi:hypothetical protein
MVVALAIAPVSLVQPVASGGVAVLAVYSHVQLEEKLATVRSGYTGSHTTPSAW